MVHRKRPTSPALPGEKRVPASYTRLAEMLAGQATLLSNTRGREKRRARRADGEKEFGGATVRGLCRRKGMENAE